MWILLISIALAITASINGQQQQPSRCVQMFDQGFRKCFRDMGGFELDIVFSLVTNETSSRLPPNLAPQKNNLVKTLCGNGPALGNCIKPMVSNADPSCKQTDIGMMDGTINSMVSGLGNLCGTAPPPSSCLQNFDKGFRTCLTSIKINPDQFFTLLANQTLPPNVNRNQLKQLSCSDNTKQSMIQCATGIFKKLQSDCKAQETIMVGTTMQNMLGAYEGMCTGKVFSPNKCMGKFENGMNTCAQKTLNMDMKMVLMVLNNQTLPTGQSATALKKQICGKLRKECRYKIRVSKDAVALHRSDVCQHDDHHGNILWRHLKWKPLENCAKTVIQTAGCKRTSLLGVEASFANIMITMATFCGDKSLPGACLLTLQKEFGTCFGKVGLSPSVYLSNATDHKGALIGATTEEAEVYCSKKHDLFTCMQEVMHGCPGAEQTLSLTGFDLHGMERAVGILCHDIPDYLAGLDCFKAPTAAARQCMEDMTVAITELSTKQITQKLSMDSFFADFCTSRVNHVACDGAAWPTCKVPAVDLKNQFECQLIPSRCYKSHKDNIDTVCPNTDHYIPAGATNMHMHKQPPCALKIRATMNACFEKYGLEPDMFLVNITHDRRNFIGDSSKAKSVCSSKASIFQCMRNTLESCPAAKEVLAFWGHQQGSLERAVDIICKELPLYSKGYQCFAGGNAQVQQCISNTESKMMNLADKQVSKNLSPDSYFRDFCSIRVEHLRCDLNGWKQTCDTDVVGLKTEFECTLLQEHCKHLQVGNYKTMCNDNTFASFDRQNGGGGGGSVGGSSGAVGTSGSIIAMMSSIVVSLLAVLL